MSLRYRLAVLGTGMVAAASLIAAGAGAASATQSSKYYYLCTTTQQLCAYARGSGNQVKMAPKASVSGLTNWYFPTSGYGVIQQANTTECMQLDHAAGNIVIESGCNTSASYQKWEEYGTGEWKSDWDTSLCLTSDNTAGTLFVAACTGAPDQVIAPTG